VCTRETEGERERECHKCGMKERERKKERDVMDGYEREREKRARMGRIS
jgi:hypothetical protein